MANASIGSVSPNVAGRWRFRIVAAIALIEAIAIVVMLSRPRNGESPVPSALGSSTVASTSTGPASTTTSAKFQGKPWPWQSADMTADDLERFGRAFAEASDRHDRATGRTASPDRAPGAHVRPQPAVDKPDWGATFSSAHFITTELPESRRLGEIWIYERQTWLDTAGKPVLGYYFKLQIDVDVKDGVWEFVDGKQFSEKIEQVGQSGDYANEPDRVFRLTEEGLWKPLAEANESILRPLIAKQPT